MKRNYGIDSLRILSMFMVCILHVLGQGGLLANAEMLSLKYWVAWFLEIACFCCVNCFVLISGYVMSGSKFRISKAVGLWLQTLFYTALIMLAFSLFVPGSVTKTIITNAFLPITTRQYWYITAYFGMLIVSPMLNTVIRHTPRKSFGYILIAVFLLFSVIPSVLMVDPYNLIGGYSMIWLCLLYVVGGYLRKYDIPNKIKSGYAWLIVLVSLTVSFLFKFIIETFWLTSTVVMYRQIFVSYTSPTIVLLSVGLLITFSKMTFKPFINNIIAFIAPATLGVYLLHVNPLIWTYIMKDFAIRFLQYDCAVMVLLIFLAALGIFVAGIIVEKIRLMLFRVLRINKLVTWLDTCRLPKKQPQKQPEQTTVE